MGSVLQESFWTISDRRLRPVPTTMRVAQLRCMPKAEASSGVVRPGCLRSPFNWRRKARAQLPHTPSSLLSSVDRICCPAPAGRAIPAALGRAIALCVEPLRRAQRLAPVGLPSLMRRRPGRRYRLRRLADLSRAADSRATLLHAGRGLGMQSELPACQQEDEDQVAFDLR